MPELNRSVSKDLTVGNRDHVGRHERRHVAACVSMIGSAVSGGLALDLALIELLDVLLAAARRALEQTRCGEDVARIRFAARRAAQEGSDAPAGTPRPAWSGRRR
jgi:hypothetical protein